VANYEKMQLDDRIRTFEQLGSILRGFDPDAAVHQVPDLQDASIRAEAENPWFTRSHIRYALNSIGEALLPEKLEQWIAPYRSRLESDRSTGVIGIVMAGNIPLVGFHDFLCVLISGHIPLVKLSASDRQLLPAIVRILGDLNPAFSGITRFADQKLEGYDAMIATGSNNTYRYFSHYFGKVPNLIRQNRNGVALLTGTETTDELNGIADDLMLYFGMGCRNVSKLYLPADYDLVKLIPGIRRYGHYEHLNKYRNNYDYYKSIFLINQVPFLDCGNLLLTEDSRLVSPISVVYYEKYTSLSDAEMGIEAMKDQIQCVVSHMDTGKSGWVRPGMTQRPGLVDYADGVDTMDFLTKLFS
jgi:hypothetical protein